MARDILCSLLLHLSLVVVTVISSPFDTGKQHQFDEVIRVRLTSLPAPVTPAPEPVTIPPAVTEDLPNIPLSKPATAKEAIIETKPEPKREEKKQKKPEELKTSGSPKQEEARTEVTAPGGGSDSPIQGATIDNASFNYPYWFDQAFRKIAGNYRNPVPYEGTLVCVVYFQVIRSGRVIELRVENPSGVKAFDNACMQAVERSTPFPPLPRTFRDEIIGITVPFKSR
ncbi:MAG: TonB family protein [Candidatus Zixiibacteriota bacterium]